MKNIHFHISSIIFIAAVFLTIGCKSDTPQPQQQIVCPKGLSFAECNNSSALHGQIMMHNMTKKGYDVTVYTHNGISENYHLMPGDGWTFTGILQGQRMIIAKQTSGDETYESHCTVIGNTQHMMNITHYGITNVGKKSHL